MGLRISGIATDKNHLSKEEIEKHLDCELEKVNELNFNYHNLPKGYCQIYNSKRGTLIICDSEIATDPFASENGICVSFVIEETSMGFSLNYCKERELKRSFMSLNDDRIEEIGVKLAIENGINDESSLIQEIVKDVIGESIFDAIEKSGKKTFKFKKINGFPISISKVKKEEGKTEVKERTNYQEVQIIDTRSEQKTVEIFDLLSNEDKNIVVNTLENLYSEDINRQTLAYCLNLSRFHWDLKVRNRATTVLEKFAPEDLWIQFQSNWNKKHLKDQRYHPKNQFENPSIDLAEYLLFAQVTRKNFYSNRPKKGMVAYVSMRYNDEIENVLDYYQVQIEKIPAKIKRLQHIRVANFRGHKNLDLIDTIEKLAELKDFHFLQVSKCEVSQLPLNITKLKSLKTLIITENPIERLPDNMVFPNLEKLDIKSTKIRTVDLSMFPKLKKLWIDGKHMLKDMQFLNVKIPFEVTSGRFFSETIEPN